MAQIKSERYTPLMKAYLTYQYNGALDGVLLDERMDTRYVVRIGTNEISEQRVTKSLWKEIEKKGGTVKRIKKPKFSGKKEVFGVETEIRPYHNGSSIEAIRIRFTGESIDELMSKKDKIVRGLEKYGLKYTLCYWERTLVEGENSTDPIEQPPVKDAEIIMRQKKLESRYEELRQDIAELKEKPIKKAMIEERRVMHGVLK